MIINRLLFIIFCTLTIALAVHFVYAIISSALNKNKTFKDSFLSVYKKLGERFHCRENGFIKALLSTIYLIVGYLFIPCLLAILLSSILAKVEIIQNVPSEHKYSHVAYVAFGKISIGEKTFSSERGMIYIFNKSDKVFFLRKIKYGDSRFSHIDFSESDPDNSVIFPDSVVKTIHAPRYWFDYPKKIQAKESTKQLELWVVE
jgi:hypothetical protein